MRLYDSDHGFEHVSDIVQSLDYKNLLNMTAEAYLKELGINERFSQEILQTATRGNYCQDLNALHALAVMVSMEAGHGTWAVESGNYNIFEEFARRSRAAIQLQTKVVAVNNITEVDANGNTVQRYVVETMDGTSQVFDEVVLSAPIKFSGIHQFPFPTKQEERSYHAVYVTLIAGHPDPSYFGKTMENMPTFVVTTGAPLGKLIYVSYYAKLNVLNVPQSTNSKTDKHLSTPFLFIAFWKMARVSSRSFPLQN